MATQAEALRQAATILATASAAGQPSITGGYVYPDDYDTMPQVPVPPVIIVSTLPGVFNSFEKKANGLELHKWRMEVLLFLSEGEISEITPSAAEAVGRVAGWPEAVSEKLWANQNLGGTVLNIGNSVGQMPLLFEYMVGHIHWGNRMYWGIGFQLEIKQTRTLTMGASSS